MVIDALFSNTPTAASGGGAQTPKELQPPSQQESDQTDESKVSHGCAHKKPFVFELRFEFIVKNSETYNAEQVYGELNVFLFHSSLADDSLTYSGWLCGVSERRYARQQTLVMSFSHSIPTDSARWTPAHSPGVPLRLVAAL